MPPKGRKAHAPDKAKAGEDEREEPLQAVVLADPFETRFRPFTLERPRSLLPLANMPLLEYTLEFLANAGVAEIIVYCGAHTDQVEAYINQSKWCSPSSPFSKLDIMRSAVTSMGDAMRDLDSRRILHGDFVLVYGDVVSNLALEPVLAGHKTRRAKDKNAIMTMVLREAGARHRTKACSTSPVFVLDPQNDRCLQFEDIPNAECTSRLHIDPEVLSAHQEMELRVDLIDCGIDIYTPEALALWSDNFDIQTPRSGYLHSVLKDYELHGKTIHTHIVSDHYAARVWNWRAYDSVSKDVVSRWAFPLCPDSNLLDGQSYRLGKRNVYKEAGVVLARDCIIHPRTVIGRGTSIGACSEVSNSIIGRNCNIGRHVILDGAYVWDGAVIGNGSVVRQAVIANEAVLGQDCTIHPGALISYGVRIGQRTTVGSRDQITRVKRKADHGRELVTAPPDPTVVGDGGDGFQFDDVEDGNECELSEGLACSAPFYTLGAPRASMESISTIHSDLEDSDVASEHDASGSVVSTDSDEGQAGQDAPHFVRDAATSVYDSLVQGHESTNIQLELTSLRMSTNASEHQVRRAIVTAFTKRILELVQGGSSVRDVVTPLLERHGDLLKRIMFDKGQADKADQVDFMLLLQAELAPHATGDSVLLAAATKLVEIDVVEEVGMQQWWKSARSTENEPMRSVREKTAQLIAFLDESSAEEESDSE